METTATSVPACATAAINGQTISVQALGGLDPHDYLRALDEVATPDQLPPGVTLTAAANSDLHLQTSSPYGFDFHFLAEAINSILEGTTGLRLDAGAEAQLSATLSANFTAALQRDDRDGRPWLRLTLNQSSGSSVQGSAHAAISAKVDIALPATPDPLLRAILGAHPLQWLRSTFAAIGSNRFNGVASVCGVPDSTIEAVFDTLQKLTASAESVLWNAAAVPTDLAEILSWCYWIANDCPTPAALRDRVDAELLRTPAFATSPIGRWLEAVAGTGLRHITGTGAWERIRKTATLLDRRTNLQKIVPDAPRLLTLLLRLPDVAAGELDLAAPSPWLFARLKAILGRDTTVSGLAGRIAAWLPLRDRIYAAAKDALATRLPAELSLLLEASTGGAALADASFAFTPGGLELLHQVLHGDLRPLYAAPSPDLLLHHGLLTHHVRRARHLELHLPFIDALSWKDQIQALSSAEVVTDASGRLITLTNRAEHRHIVSNRGQSTLLFASAFSARDAAPLNDNFTLTFEDVRQVSAGGHHQAWIHLLNAYGIQPPTLPEQPAQATLTVLLPGRFAEFWTFAPHPREREYYPALCRIARALQLALRRWLPIFHFADPAAYRNPGAAYPLLAYQYSAPCSEIKTHRLNYDFMSRDDLHRAIASAAPGIHQVLPSIQRTLIAAGFETAAAHYDRRYLNRSLNQVALQQRNFQALISADTFFIESMIHLLADTAALHALNARKPLHAIRKLTTYSQSFVKALHGRLHRLYGNDEFLALGSLLLIEATSALAGGGAGPIPLQATLTLEQNGRTSVHPNEAARRG